LIFVDLIRFLLCFCSFAGLNHEVVGAAEPPRHADQDLVKCVLLASDTSRRD